MLPRNAADLVRHLVAHSREAGTGDAANARHSIAEFLGGCGYRVIEQPFSFNAGIYRVFPVAGTALTFTALLQPLLLHPPFPAWASIAVLAGTCALVLAMGARVVWGAHGAHSRNDANLIAVRQPDAAPRRWLVAHLDTKAQAQSMAGRLLAVWMALVSTSVLAVLGVARLAGPVDTLAVSFVALLGCITGGLVMRGRLQGTTPGARDNGSGLLAVLTAAERSSDPATGVIITGAEEFGLAGARALVRERPELFRHAEVVNVDTVDDQGTLYVIVHTPRSTDLALRTVARCGNLDIPVQQRLLPLGIMVDGVPLAREAAAAITLGRLNWGTLRRLHTPRDTADQHRFWTASALGERLANPI